MSQGNRKLIVLGIVALACAFPASAMAQSSTATNDNYEDTSITFVGDVGGSDSGDPANPADPGTTSTGSGTGETLPFSGLDVALIAAMGGGLALLGFGMRRLTRRPGTV